MTRLGVVVLLCLIEGVAIGGPGWSITWPTEWTDVTQQALKEPALQAALKQLAGEHASTDVAARADAEGHVVQVLYTALPLEGGDGTNTAAIARGLEQGARNAATTKAAREVSYNQREVDNTLVADQTLELNGATIYVRWIAGAGHGRARLVQATCNASQTLCATALASLTLDGAELEPLTSSNDRVNRAIMNIGLWAGVLIGVWIGLRLHRRRHPERATVPENQRKRLLLAIGLGLLILTGWNLLFR